MLVGVLAIPAAMPGDRRRCRHRGAWRATEE